MDHPHGPSGQRSFRRRGLLSIRGDESATVAGICAGLCVGISGGMSRQKIKQHLAQFAFSEIIRPG